MSLQNILNPRAPTLLTLAAITIGLCLFGLTLTSIQATALGTWACTTFFLTLALIGTFQSLSLWLHLPLYVSVAIYAINCFFPLA